MRTFHQVLVGAGPGDAITNMARQSREALRRLGPSEIFARFIDPASTSEVRALQDLPLGRPSDVVVYHSSFGDPDVTKALLRRPERLVLVYHNITPAEFFADTDPEDITNCTNRAPFPTLHLLREASLDRAVAAFPDAALIYERNMQTLRELGTDGWQTLGVGTPANEGK